MLNNSTGGSPLKRSLILHRSQRGKPVSYIWMGILETLDECRPEIRPHAVMILSDLGFFELLFFVPSLMSSRIHREVMGEGQSSPAKFLFEHGKAQTDLFVHANGKIPRRVGN